MNFNNKATLEKANAAISRWKNGRTKGFRHPDLVKAKG